jgi:hypothetical protein
MAINGFPIEILGDSKRLKRPVGASETIYNGAFVGYDSGGYIIPIPADASGELVDGLAYTEETIDNSTGSAGDRLCEYFYNPLAWFTLASAAVTDIGSIVYPTSTIGTVTKTGSNSPVGKIKDWDGGTKVLVDMSVKA